LGTYTKRPERREEAHYKAGSSDKVR
jgi:hypothetical protein